MMFQLVIIYLIPYLTKLLIKEIKTEQEVNVKCLIISISIILTKCLIGLLNENFRDHRNKFKAASGQILRGIFFEKIKNANYRFLYDADAGFISTMINQELDQIADFFAMIPSTCSSPISFIVSYVFIYLQIGYRIWLPSTIFVFLLSALVLMKLYNVQRKNFYQNMNSARASIID